MEPENQPLKRRFRTWKPSLQVPRKTLGSKMQHRIKKTAGSGTYPQLFYFAMVGKETSTVTIPVLTLAKWNLAIFQRIYCFGGPGICWCQPGNCCTSPSTSTRKTFSPICVSRFFTARYPNLPPKAYRSSNQFQLRVKHRRESHGHH